MLIYFTVAELFSSILIASPQTLKHNNCPLQKCWEKRSWYCKHRIILIKLLGVHIDENLNLTWHISKLCMKANQKVVEPSRLRNLIPCKAKLLLYKFFILPYLTYCHLTCHFCKSSDNRTLERIHERALGVIHKSHSAT